jgi:hypothetical protein
MVLWRGGGSGGEGAEVMVPLRAWRRRPRSQKVIAAIRP